MKENHFRIMAIKMVRILEDDTDNKLDVYIAWLCKVLQNNKAVIFVPNGRHTLYEVTYNGDTGEFYADAYNKIENRVMTFEEVGA